MDRTFDYLGSTRWTAEVAASVVPGTIVRVPLHGRQVRGWVVASDVEPAGGVALREITAVLSAGPAPEIVELAGFAAWRYAGPLRAFLAAGSPPRLHPELLGRGLADRISAVLGDQSGREVATRGETAVRTATLSELGGRVAALVAEAWAGPCTVLRFPPAGDRLAVVEAALETSQVVAERGGLLVVVPELAEVAILAGLLERRGWPVAVLPSQWAEAARGGAAGGVVLGTRNAVLGPVPRCRGIVVLDAHADQLVAERAPTFSAAELACERARRSGVACLLVGPCPPVSQLAGRRLVADDPAIERAGWPRIEVIDRRGDDPRSGHYSELLVARIRQAVAASRDRPVCCVLNRKGRGRLLACAGCGHIRRCERCGGALQEQERSRESTAADEGSEKRAKLGLSCDRCRTSAGPSCPACGSARFRVLRSGVDRVAEELAAVTGCDVGLYRSRRSAPAPGLAALRPEVLVGTEALLHGVRSASLVAFLDFDAELAAPRLSAGEAALALLALGGRLVGGRRRDGRILVQTRMPDHEVLEAATRGDPSVLARQELERRGALRLPPFAAMAICSGEAVADLEARLVAADLEVHRLSGGELAVRAPDHRQLCDALAAELRERPGGLRIEVDPRSI